MEQQLSDILDNLLGMLLLEGSYEIEEAEDSFLVSIETKDAGRLIGARGESLDSLQLLVNQMLARKVGERATVPSEPVLSEAPPKAGEVEVVEGFKRVVIDVEGWRKQKEEELAKNAQEWAKQVLETGKSMELEPQSAWQRRIIHMVIGEIKGLSTESTGEGRDRHIVIKIKDQRSNIKDKEQDAETQES